jgi:uncharacterized protein (TIGR02996 family)
VTDLLRDETYAALLANVRAHPDADELRLILADRMEELGEPEAAELVRLQSRLAELEELTSGDWHGTGLCAGHCRLCPEEKELLERRTDIVAVNSPRWFPAAWRTTARPDCFPDPGMPPRFSRPGIVFLRRGLAAEVSCDFSSWRDGGSALVRHPLACVQRVTLADMPVHMSRGNMTYYVGGLGRFPREYWDSLDRLPSERAALSAISAAALAWAWSAAPVPA